MERCQEERTEDVLGKIEAKPGPKIHQAAVFEGQFPNESLIPSAPGLSLGLASVGEHCSS